MSSRINRTAQYLAGALCLAISSAALGAQNLDDRLQQQLASVDARFVGHEAVTVAKQPTAEKYLILDFRVDSQTDESALQYRIHSICSRVLTDRALVKDLSDQGYNMVAVAFDERSQYDCL